MCAPQKNEIRHLGLWVIVMGILVAALISGLIPSSPGLYIKVSLSKTINLKLLHLPNECLFSPVLVFFLKHLRDTAWL